MDKKSRIRRKREIRWKAQILSECAVLTLGGICVVQRLAGEALAGNHGSEAGGEGVKPKAPAAVRGDGGAGEQEAASRHVTDQQAMARQFTRRTRIYWYW